MTTIPGTPATVDDELALMRNRPAAAPVAPEAPPVAPEAAPAQPEAQQEAGPEADPASLETTEQTTIIGAPEPAADAAPDLSDDYLPPLDGAGFGESFSAAWTAETIRTDAWRYREEKSRELATSMFDMLPPEAQERIRATRRDPSRAWESFTDLVIEEVGRDIARDPLRYGDVPITREAFDARIDKERRDALDAAEAVLDLPGGGVAEFLGTGARAMTDETSLMLLPFGASGSPLRFVLGEAALGAAGEAAILPRENRVADELGLERPDAATRIGLGAVLGGGLAGAIVGGGRVAGYFQQREIVRRDAADLARPENTDALEAEAEVGHAERVLRGEANVQESVTPPAGAAPEAGTLGAVLAQGGPTTAIPPVPVDAPAGWAQIRNGIFVGESGGDYNALFGYSNRQGGPFANVRLTDMTVDEAIAFSSPNGAYGQWVKRRIGRVATPMGAYQIVGTTLRQVKKGLGLRGDELMTPELQERMGIYIYRTQGTGAWEGYRGPRASFTPSAEAGSYSGPTSRGYTQSGQIVAGDRFRIDVDYEVVDLSTLIRASGDLQPRDRSTAASNAWVAEKSAALDPVLLMPAPNAAQGTPIVGADNIIDSGNGRAMIIQRAYEMFPDRAAAYRGAIEGAGFAIPEGMERPVLIARRKTEFTPPERIEFAAAAQDGGTVVLTPVELARITRGSLDPALLGRFDPSQPLTADANADFVRDLVKKLPSSARNAMVSGEGATLSAAGVKSLREALFARAWPDDDMIARYIEGDPGELKSLIEALEKSAPAWAALRSDIEAGLVRQEMDISGHVLDAMRLIGNAREVARVEKARRKAAGSTAAFSIGDALEELLTNADMLEGAVAPLTVAMVRKFWAKTRPARAEEIADFLTRYAEDARKVGAEGGMFDAPGPRDVLARIDKAGFADLPEDLGTPRGFARPGQTAPAAAARPADLPDQGFDAGAASPEAMEADALIAAEVKGEAPAEAAPAVSAAEIMASLSATAPRRVVDFQDLPVSEQAELGRALKSAQPYDTAEAVFEAATVNHGALNDAAGEVAARLGLEFKRAPVKKLDRIQSKVADKYQGDFRKIADVARTGVTARTIEEADAFVAGLAERFHLIDEGWIVTPAGYFDRKLMVRFDDGQLGEVQIWPPGMLDAKGAGGGHKLYEVSRDPAQPEAARAQAVEDMRALYAEVAAELDPSFAAKLGFDAPRAASSAAASASDSSTARSSASTSSASARDPAGGDQAPSSDSSLATPSSDTAAISDRSNENSFMGKVPSITQDRRSVGATPANVNLAQARAEFGDIEMEMPDGTTIRARDLLDDLEADDGFNAVIQACAITPNQGASA